MSGRASTKSKKPPAKCSRYDCRERLSHGCRRWRTPDHRQEDQEDRGRRPWRRLEGCLCRLRDGDDGLLPAAVAAQRHNRRAAEDRKSVVEGKSVSVRVDLVGRRIIKTEHNKTQHIAF